MKQNQVMGTGDSDLTYRTAQDLIKRSYLGPYIYPVFWPLVAVSADFHQAYPNVFVASTLIFFVASIARLFHVHYLPAFYPKRYALWNRLLYITVLPHSLVWGLLFTMSLIIENQTFAVFMAFSSAGLVAGGTNSFAPNKGVSYSFILSFLLPPLLVALYLPQHWITAVMLILYWVYMLGLSRNQQREYWVSLENEITLSKQSRTDALTNLDNRRFFDEKLNEFCHLSSRNHERLSLLLVDCDFFKNINDKFGHDFGDECLKHLATLFKQALPRTTDVCARYGGEEFSIILPGANINGAKIVAERIRQLVESTSVIHNGDEISMTVSIGCVSRRISQFSEGLPAELFKKADEALYMAKRRGRNQCAYSRWDEALATYVFG